MDQKIKQKFIKKLPFLVFAISAVSFVGIFWRAKAIRPVEYLGFPLGFYHPPIMCNCVIDAICECLQPEFLTVNLFLDIVVWFLLAILIGFVVSSVVNRILR